MQAMKNARAKNKSVRRGAGKVTSSAVEGAVLCASLLRVVCCGMSAVRGAGLTLADARFGALIGFKFWW